MTSRPGPPIEPSQGAESPADEPSARVVWTTEARRKLLPRRSGAGSASSRVHKPGLLAELAELGRRASLDVPGSALSSRDAGPPNRDLGAWREMRRLLAEADAETYAEVKSVAARMRVGASLALRCSLSFAFATETAWSSADAIASLELAASGRPPPPCAALLFASIADADLASRLVQAYPSGAARVARAEHAMELVESIGVAAEAPLILLFEEARATKDARSSKEVSEMVSRCLEALELIQSERVAATFARHLGANEVRPHAARYFQAAPRLAMRALAPLATARGRAAEAAKTLLLSAVVSSPELVAALLPRLEGAARRGVKAALDQAGTPYQEASPDEIPAVLVRPPWRDKSARRARVLEDLPVLDERAPLDASALSRDEWATTINWVPNSLVFSPRVALPVAHAWIHQPDSRAAADAWLSAFPETAAVGLIPAAVGNPGALRTDAGRMLRLLEQRGAGDAIRSAAARYGEEAAAIIEDVLALDPLFDCPEGPPKLPDFLRIEALPRPRLAARASIAGADPAGRDEPHIAKVLPLRAVLHLCEMLAFSSEDFPYAGIEAVRAACDKASLAELAWAIVAAWLASGGSMKIPWPLRALAAIGGDEGARRLSPRIRAWADEKSPLRASAGVDALARIGTDVALMRLSIIAHSSRFPELQRRARDRIAAVADARGLSEDQLADRLVPDLDLDRDGSKVLDYGPRSFRVGFDEHLEPFVRDDAGGALASLPRPTRGDDPEKAKAAQALWRGLRDDTEVIAKGQIRRLELAMATRRRWTPSELRAFLIDHPLMVHLARRLVWGAFDASGALVTTFRVAEDRTLASSSDAPFDLPSDLLIGVPHPLDMEPASLREWGGILADYGVVQPFEQLGRSVFLPDEAERGATILRRVEGVRVPTGKIFGVLERRDWRREAEMDGVVGAYAKDLALGRHVAILEIHPGIRLLRLHETPEQTLGVVSLMRDRTLSTRATFGELDPVVFSELARDLDRLRG